MDKKDKFEKRICIEGIKELIDFKGVVCDAL